MRLYIHVPHLLLLTRVAMLAFIMGLSTVACNRQANSPVSPTPETAATQPAAADGSTLKAPAPGTVSPTGGAQVTDPTVLTASTVSAKFGSASFQYRFQVRSGSTVVATGVVGPTTGPTATFQPAGLQNDTTYTWRVQATLSGSDSPWSGDASFKAPVGAFIRGNEVRDPLTIGRTVGEIRGPAQFTADGLKLLAHESHVLYRLPVTLQEGQFSMLILGADEGSEGDKSKVFAMQEGPEEQDITTDDYRMTAELRGANYAEPGSITCRIIAGDDVSRDCSRSQKNFSSSRWYFWSFKWRTGSATLEVRNDSETGSVLYSSTVGTGTHPYRPEQHFLYLGSPAGRAGLLDATLPGGTYKNVYVGPNARPTFPGVER